MDQRKKKLAWVCEKNPVSREASAGVQNIIWSGRLYNKILNGLKEMIRRTIERMLNNCQAKKGKINHGSKLLLMSEPNKSWSKTPPSRLSKACKRLRCLGN